MRLKRVLDHTKALDFEAKPNACRAREVELMYDISAEDYLAMAMRQNGACAICGRRPDRDATGGKIRRGKCLCVDHCHATDKVRGLLCDTCNSGLGMFKDSADLLRLAAAYLERSRE